MENGESNWTGLAFSTIFSLAGLKRGEQKWSTGLGDSFSQNQVCD